MIIETMNSQIMKLQGGKQLPRQARIGLLW